MWLMCKLQPYSKQNTISYYLNEIFEEWIFKCLFDLYANFLHLKFNDFPCIFIIIHALYIAQPNFNKLLVAIFVYLQIEGTWKLETDYSKSSPESDCLRVTFTKHNSTSMILTVIYPTEVLEYAEPRSPTFFCYVVDNFYSCFERNGGKFICNIWVLKRLFY